MFRPDVQILRGVAVLAVMLAHFGSLLAGGFLGVDIFFAISGFVITLSFINLRDKTLSNRVLLRLFWFRRFWRLFPALSLVLSVTLVAAFVLLPASEYGDQWEMSAWSFFFFGNVGAEVVSQEDYFDPAAQSNWLLHLWSLGVEEQFYLIFPFLMIGLLAILRTQKGGVRAVFFASLLSIVSFILASINEISPQFLWVSESGSSGLLSFLLGYYSPFTRAWQFGVGVVAALMAIREPERRDCSPHPATRRLLWMLGAGLLAISMLLTPESELLPGPITLVPMAAMFIFLRFPLSAQIGQSPWLRPLIWLGDKSYSVYLWHWPVWQVLGLFAKPSIPVILASFAITLCLAHVTNKWLERPIIEWSKQQSFAQRGPLPIRRHKFRLAFTFLMVFPLGFGGGVKLAETVLYSIFPAPEKMSVERIPADLNCRVTDCNSLAIDVLLVGDSHAGVLAQPLSELLSQDGIVLKGAIHEGCFHLPSLEIRGVREECRQTPNDVRTLIQTTRPRVVIFMGYTAGRFTTMNSGKEQALGVFYGETGSEVTEGSAPSAYRIAVLESARFVEELGADTILVEATPDYLLRPENRAENGREASMFLTLLKIGDVQTEGHFVTLEDYEARHGPFVSVDREASANSERVKTIDSWSALCRSTGCSQISTFGERLFSDTDHLTKSGAARLARPIADATLEIFLRDQSAGR